MSKTTIKFKGREFELFKNLDPEEFNHLDASLGPYKKLMLSITKKVMVTNAKAKGWLGPQEIWLLKKGNCARLSYPQGHEEAICWD